MDWARILTYVTGTVDQDLLARNEYLAAENRILKGLSLPKTTSGNKEQPVRCREPWLGGKPAPQQVQLMAQEDNLGLKPRLRLERQSQCMQQQAKERDHSAETIRSACPQPCG
jgi:hypothetical protein